MWAVNQRSGTRLCLVSHMDLKIAKMSLFFLIQDFVLCCVMVIISSHGCWSDYRLFKLFS